MDNNLVKLDSWDELISALECEYTTSIRDICKILKTSRSWVNTYITPYVKYIYISNGKGKNADYVRIAARHKERYTEDTKK